MNHNGLSQCKGKREWRICPRCGVEAISKDLRKCLACKGRVYFRTGADCDTFEKSIEIMESFYCWDKPVVSGLEGYYPLDFYGITFGGRK